MNIDRAAFDALLDELNAKFNPKVCMVTSDFSSPGYHTTLTGGQVHSTRTAFGHAVALLDSGNEEYRLRAIDVFSHTIDLQETDPAEPTFGIWSWFYEEPLDKMSPPDFNWADFCGKELMQIARFHSRRLPDWLNEKIKSCVYNACMSIFRRNMHPGYTNIAIMGSYVTLSAGQWYDWDFIHKYGASRLKKFTEDTLNHGAFTEYNSPTYTVVALEDLRSAFTSCPPHDASCCYRKPAVSLTPGRVTNGVQAEVASAYLCPEYALSSFANSDTWNQRRNLLSYWGGEEPRFMALRLLHDFYDYSSGMLTTAQLGGSALTVASFVTDGGDTHCNLDMVKNATIRARDLRLRLEIGNSPADVTLSGDIAQLTDGDISLEIRLIAAKFGGSNLSLELSSSEDTSVVTATMPGQANRIGADSRKYIDVVFYSGEETEINFDAIAEAYAALSIAFAVPAPSGDVIIKDDRLVYTAGSLKVATPHRPVKRAVWRSEAWADGVSLSEKYF